MSGPRGLISWQKPPLPVPASFSHFLKSRFSEFAGKTLFLDPTRCQNLAFLTNLTDFSPFTLATAVEFQDAGLFLTQQGADNWVILCEWPTFQAVLESHSLSGAFCMLIQSQATLTPVATSEYEKYCSEMNCCPYVMKLIDIGALQSASMRREREDERKTEAPELAQIDAKLNALRRELKLSETRTAAQTSLVKTQITAQLQHISIQTVSDPTLQGQSIGQSLSLDLKELVSARDGAAEVLCGLIAAEIGRNMQELGRSAVQTDLQYHHFFEEMQQRTQKLTECLQKTEGKYASDRQETSYQSDLEEIEREIEALTLRLASVQPSVHYPLRILVTCGRVLGTQSPCPVLVIQWKNCEKQQQLRVVFSATRAFCPSEAVLTEEVTVLPYDCAEMADLTVMDANKKQSLCRKSIEVAPSISFSSFLDWQIDKEGIAREQRSLLALI